MDFIVCIITIDSNPFSNNSKYYIACLYFQFANLLQAALCLVKELDVESLTTLEDAIKHKIQALT